MTITRFDFECTTRTIDPCIALENEKMVAALKERDDQKVVELLETEF